MRDFFIIFFAVMFFVFISLTVISVSDTRKHAVDVSEEICSDIGDEYVPVKVFALVGKVKCSRVVGDYHVESVYVRF